VNSPFAATTESPHNPSRTQARTHSRTRIAWVAGAVALLVVVMLGLIVGAVSLPIADVIAALKGQGDQTTLAIVRDLRLPRVLLAALVGAGLAMSGGALQGTLHNPLAEPYLLGVSGGAAVGAVIAMVLGAGMPWARACARGRVVDDGIGERRQLAHGPAHHIRARRAGRHSRVEGT